MSKLLILLIMSGALSFAQQADPAAETRKTTREKGYHKTSPKNTGPTPEQDKDKPSKDKKATETPGNDGLKTQRPPTRQPELAPPNKP